MNLGRANGDLNHGDVVAAEARVGRGDGGGVRGIEQGQGDGEGTKVAGVGSNLFLFTRRMIPSAAVGCVWGGGGASERLCNYYITLKHIKLIKENILHA